jgi:hypothetical protein
MSSPSMVPTMPLGQTSWMPDALWLSFVRNARDSDSNANMLTRHRVAPKSGYLLVKTNPSLTKNVYHAKPPAITTADIPKSLHILQSAPMSILLHPNRSMTTGFGSRLSINPKSRETFCCERGSPTKDLALLRAAVLCASSRLLVVSSVHMQSGGSPVKCSTLQPTKPTTTSLLLHICVRR